MGIQRFRDISEVPTPQRVIDIEERARRIEAVWQQAHLRGPIDVPRGVQRFRNIEEANRARQSHTKGRMRRLRGSGSSTGEEPE